MTNGLYLVNNPAPAAQLPVFPVPRNVLPQMAGYVVPPPVYSLGNWTKAKRSPRCYTGHRSLGLRLKPLLRMGRTISQRRPIVFRLLG